MLPGLWLTLLLPFAAMAQQDTTVVLPDTFVCMLHETPASFPGGQKTLAQFIQENMYYPEGTADIQGKVVLAFDVLKDGTITHIKVIRSLHPELDKVALRMMRNMPHWNPATLYNKPVDTHYVMPVFFIPE